MVQVHLAATSDISSQLSSQHWSNFNLLMWLGSTLNHSKNQSWVENEKKYFIQPAIDPWNSTSWMKSFSCCFPCIQRYPSIKCNLNRDQFRDTSFALCHFKKTISSFPIIDWFHPMSGFLPLFHCFLIYVLYKNPDSNFLVMPRFIAIIPHFVICISCKKQYAKK